jgi:hypothetical protein
LFFTCWQVARFEDILDEFDDVDFDEVVDDEEESQEQRALEKAKKMKEKNVAKQVEISLCVNIFLQRCVCCCTATSTCFIIVFFAHSP